MDDSDTLQWAGPSRPADRPAFELVSAKLRHPVIRPGTVRRSALIARLTDEDTRPIVSVVAPAGYGKTTLLSQWAEADGQAFAWVSVDEADNDPRVLLAYVAAALDAVEPVGQRVFDALASPQASVPGSVVPRLCNAFASMTVPVTLVLDDVHLLRDSGGRAALSVLAEHVPAGSRLVLAGRDQPPVRIARLRAAGQILEIGAGDLALTAGEAASLLAAAEVALGEADLAELHRRTEGWAAGLYLAALSLREGGSLPGMAASFGGDDRFVADYVESEFLARIPPSQRAFLTRTAVLERMSGPLCAAVLELPGAGAVLAELASSNLLLVPLDRRGQWYRYHHLFRDMLRAELERDEPALVPVLRRRAAGWCQRHDLPEEALEYAMAAGDVETAGDLIDQLAIPAYRQARLSTLQQWLRWLEERDGMEGHPMAVTWASLAAAIAGRPAEAERWADAVDRWLDQDTSRPADPAAEAWATMLRYTLCRQGSSRCVPTLTRPCRGSRRPVSWRRPSRSLRESRASCAVTSMAATCSSRTASESGTGPLPMFTCGRWPSEHWWRWNAIDGTRPRPWPTRPAPSWTGRGSRSTPCSARCRPAWRCTGGTSRRRGGSSSAHRSCGPC